MRFGRHPNGSKTWLSTQTKGGTTNHYAAWYRRSPPVRTGAGLVTREKSVGGSARVIGSRFPRHLAVRTCGRRRLTQP